MKHAPPKHRARVLSLAVFAPFWIGACTQAADWREVRPPGWALTMVMPCRPASHVRQVPLPGAAIELMLFACSDQEHTFAVSSALLADPASVGPALAQLSTAARANVRGQEPTDQPAAIPGMTPQAAARRWRMAGTLPDGRTVVEEVVVFSHGLRVYQATVLGPSAGPALAAPFFDGLRVAP